MTKERPILFSGPMVRAILEGRKTQTRRVVKIPGWFTDEYGARFEAEELHAELESPYGQPVDRLWTRETHRFTTGSEDAPLQTVVYRATDPDNDGCDAWGTRYKWRPSIFMPRWASRINLEVTDVRVERVQDISEEDAIAEGVDEVSQEDVPRQATWSRRQDFAQLWDSINAKRGYSWESNPWVWVVEFKRHGSH